MPGGSDRRIVCDDAVIWAIASLDFRFRLEEDANHGNTV